MPGHGFGKMEELSAVIHFRRNEFHIQAEQVMDLVFPDKGVPVLAGNTHHGTLQRHHDPQVFHHIILIKTVSQFVAFRNPGAQDLHHAVPVFFILRCFAQQISSCCLNKNLFHFPAS